MALRDQPYIPLYIQDFMTDEKLRECTPESIGIFVFVMCVMHKSEEYGTILLKQKDKQKDKQINNFACKLDKHLPFRVSEIEKALNELLEEKVLTLDGDILSQKRMVKDNKLSLIRSKAGKKGGNKTKFAQAKGEAKPQANPESESEVESEVEIPIETEDVIETEMYPTVREFLELYDKNAKRPEVYKEWQLIDQKDREILIEIVPEYVKATPNKRYRMNPSEYLKNRAWEDEIIKQSENGNQKNSEFKHVDVSHIR